MTAQTNPQLFELILILTALFIIAFFLSIIREALLEISRERVEDFEKTFNKAKIVRLRRLMKKPSAVVASILIIKIITLILIFALTYSIYRHLELSVLNRFIYWLIFTASLIVFLEFIPQIIGYRKNFVVLRNFMPVIEVVYFILSPFIIILKFITNIVLRLFGSKGFKSLNYIDEAELELLLENAPRYKEVEEMEKDMITGIIEFRDMVVREVMVPRINMICVAKADTIAQSLNIIMKSGHSRIPVFAERIDDIVGVLYAKDILRIETGQINKDQSVSKIMRNPIFVPETKKLNELLLEFKEAKAHLAIVVDEYGGTSGIVTIEDLLEEIVGEIEDEFDKVEKLKYHKTKDGDIETDAQVDIDKLNEVFHLELPTEETYESIGGLIIEKVGYVPAPGEKFNFDNFSFEIIDADEKHIKKVRFFPNRGGNYEKT